MRTSAPFVAALVAAGSITATAPATVSSGTQAVSTVSAIPCWKTWQSVRDAVLHHTTPPGCQKTHRRATNR